MSEPTKTAATQPHVATNDGDGENTTVQVARTANEVREGSTKAAAPAAGDKHHLGWKTAAGIGIGSAALVAALLYARRR